MAGPGNRSGHVHVGPMSNPIRVFACIDEFNLYDRAFKGYPAAQWLDVRKLLEGFLLPSQSLEKINYSTAMLAGQRDPGQQLRQQVYLRALRTVPGLTMHRGRFLTKEICRPLKRQFRLYIPTRRRPASNL